MKILVISYILEIQNFIFRCDLSRMKNQFQDSNIYIYIQKLSHVSQKIIYKYICIIIFFYTKWYCLNPKTRNYPLHSKKIVCNAWQFIVKTDQLYIPSIRGEDYNLHTTYNEQLLIRIILLMIRKQPSKSIYVPNRDPHQCATVGRVKIKKRVS